MTPSMDVSARKVTLHANQANGNIDDDDKLVQLNHKTTHNDEPLNGEYGQHPESSEDDEDEGESGLSGGHSNEISQLVYHCQDLKRQGHDSQRQNQLKVSILDQTLREQKYLVNDLQNKLLKHQSIAHRHDGTGNECDATHRHEDEQSDKPSYDPDDQDNSELDERMEMKWPHSLSSPSAYVGRQSGAESPSNPVVLESLQERLRSNVELRMSEQLNTLTIARTVREYLSVHNIGQRLFAKYVLGLSQGTVSELLSKPKPWDKLTEKGRNSYRKMHAWTSDDQCIQLLKSLVPRKCKEQVGSNQGDSSNRNDPQESHDSYYTAGVFPSIGWPLPAHPPLPPPLGIGLGGLNLNSASAISPSEKEQRTSPEDESNISREIVSRIYKEELAKLISQQASQASNIFPFGLIPGVPEQPRSAEEIQQALLIYYQELARLSHLSTMRSPFMDAVPPFTALDSAARLTNNTFPNISSPGPSVAQSQCPSPAVYDMKRMTPKKMSSVSSSPALPRNEHSPSPIETGNSRDEPAQLLSSSLSPLSKMQSITNSLLTSSSNGEANPLGSLGMSAHSVLASPRNLKITLPPVTQQQFDLYNNLNTEDIVRLVKDQLSQYSISQRLFGESVLGLSQGSVSDLLARPKPWHMLTQKGREPFIRMKMFLEDESAVHNLVASQYKIAPEKLMRTGGGFTPGPTGPLLTHSALPTLPVVNPVLDSLISFSQTTPCFPAGVTERFAISPSSTPELKVKHMPQPAFDIKKLPGNGTPTLYELASLIPELDTLWLTTRVKEVLLANNIGQKVFGEVILGLSQGSVSELLSKPKSWHLLSVKGREPFVSMYLWLNDPQGAEKLKNIKSSVSCFELFGGYKLKRRQTEDGIDLEPPTSMFSSMFSGDSCDSSSASLLNTTGNIVPPVKKARILFSTEQKEALKLAFSLDSYPSKATVEFLAKELNLSQRTITNWFHNHRMRSKQVPVNQQIAAAANGSFSCYPAKQDEEHQEEVPNIGRIEAGQEAYEEQFRALFAQRMAKINGAAAMSNHVSQAAKRTQVNNNVARLALGPPPVSHFSPTCSSMSSSADAEPEQEPLDENENIKTDLSLGLDLSISKEKDNIASLSTPVCRAGTSKRKSSKPQYIAPLQKVCDELADEELIAARQEACKVRGSGKRKRDIPLKCNIASTH